ncbi:feruloyl esterase B-2 [Fusarium phyllophilum]|uniref:Carboxylic ester hydrolase n=1 Tax=Fusarium phyllophilum TaxID=47803 RepID=A0A8H5JNS5_9HYPO|nr:feruloyl esterase B-2 [Fusarium phyllophilum]
MLSSTSRTLLCSAALGVSSINAETHSRCLAGGLLIPNGTIASVQHHAVGDVIALPNTVTSSGGPNFKANVTIDFCRIVVNVSTSDSSSVRIEAWLPDDWNKRLLATGTGGIGGCIDFSSVQNSAQLGFASFGTNTGHDGEKGFDFFLNQPEVINDFGHRGIHVEAVVAKQIVQQYYGKKASQSYYQGCSTGGRQGHTSTTDWMADLSSEAYVRPEQWKAIAEKQIELLDPLDGVENGIIDNPAAHAFDPAIMACGTGLLNSSLCLKPRQRASVRVAYEPLADSEGNIVYPAFVLGADTSVFSENQVNGTAELNYKVLQDFWRGAVYNDSTWTPHNFTVKDMDFAVKLNTGGVNAAEGELQKFYAKGGNIISYHGQADQTITPKLPLSITPRFKPTSTPHCRICTPSTDYSSFLGCITALEALAHSILVRFGSSEAPGKATAQRKYCPYPFESTWDGSGNTTMADSWRCKLPGV